MVATPNKERSPSGKYVPPERMSDLTLLRNIYHDRITSEQFEHALNNGISPALKNIAVPLYEARRDGGTSDFLTVYQAYASVDYPELAGWEDAVKTGAPPVEEGPKWGKYKPLTLLEMAQKPRPIDIIEGIFYEKTVAELFGAAGTKKSFLAFDWFAHIALGIPWQGHVIKKPGKCVYTLAEGADNFIKRALAWCSYHHVPLEKLSENLFIVDREIPLSNAAEIEEYISDVGEFIHNVAPVAVSFDTLMRCSGGENINAPDVMAKLYDGANRIRRELDASHVLIVHHEGKDSTKGSAGSFVLRANCDIVHRLSCDETTGALTLSCNPNSGGKMKDKAEYPDIYLNTRPVYYTEEMLNDDSSLVIIEGDKPAPRTPKLTPARQVALDALPHESALSYSEWKSSIDSTLTAEDQPVMGKPTFDKCREWLTQRGFVRKDDQGRYWRNQEGEE